MIKRFKSAFLTLFRSLFVYHHQSLEFRAKILTAVMIGKSEITECEKDLLEEVAQSIYPDDEYRIDVLVNTVYEYLKIVEVENGQDLDKLIFDINRDIRFNKRYRKKIDIDLLKRFMLCTKDPDDMLMRHRVIEFLENIK